MQSLDFVYHLYDYRPNLDSSQSYSVLLPVLRTIQQAVAGREVRVLNL